MDALSEEDAGGTVELRYDDALGTVDDESAPFGHVRDGTQIHVLNRGVEILMLRICAVELQLCLQRHAVCQPSVETFVDRVAGRVDEVVYEFEYEIVSGIGDGEYLLEYFEQSFITAVFRCGVQLEEILTSAVPPRNRGIREESWKMQMKYVDC